MGLTRHPALTAGIALGILYIFEGMFSTGILFAVWPILGGVFAAALLKWNPAMPLTPASGARAAAGAAVIAGLVAIIFGTPLSYWLMRRVGESPEFFGTTFDLSPLLQLVVMYLIYSVGAGIVAAAAGALTGLLGGSRERRAH